MCPHIRSGRLVGSHLLLSSYYTWSLRILYVCHLLHRNLPLKSQAPIFLGKKTEITRYISSLLNISSDFQIESPLREKGEEEENGKMGSEINTSFVEIRSKRNCIKQAINKMDQSFSKKKKKKKNKMDQSKIRKDHVVIEVDKLAKSLRGKIDTLNPLSKDCCIYRVPPKVRMLNETLYTPKMVSIGPLHHGREELKAMQEHKLRCLQQFLLRTHVHMVEFLTSIKDREADLRNCYLETINFGSDEFVEMVLLDAVFLIEIFLRCNSEVCVEEILDRIFTKPRMIKDIVLDIILLENQLPIFILEDLFKLANPNVLGNSLSQLAAKFFFNCHICKDVLIDENLIESSFSKAKHFVDLLRICLQPPKRDDTETERRDDSEVVPSVTKLHQAGVKFKATTKNLLDIRFNKGTLEIPKLTIGNMTEKLLRNLHIFEGLHCDDTNYMNDYGMILNRLLNISTDVELLIHIGVIDNRILDSEGVLTLFQQLSKDARVDKETFYYSGLVKDLQSYCKSPCHKWKANLKQNYFNTPWASISVIAAVIILVLTFIQTVCSIVGL